VQLAEIADSPKVWYIITGNNSERKPFLAGLHYLAGTENATTVGLKQKSHHHAGIIWRILVKN
jgi:hypothetical protein